MDKYYRNVIIGGVLSMIALVAGGYIQYKKQRILIDRESLRKARYLEEEDARISSKTS